MRESTALTLLLALLPVGIGPVLSAMGFDAVDTRSSVLVAGLLGALGATLLTLKVHPKDGASLVSVRTHLTECAGLYALVAFSALLAVSGEGYARVTANLGAGVCIPAIVANAIVLRLRRRSRRSESR
jgi:hypothetical protein